MASGPSYELRLSEYALYCRARQSEDRFRFMSFRNLSESLRREWLAETPEVKQAYRDEARRSQKSPVWVKQKRVRTRY